MPAWFRSGEQACARTTEGVANKRTGRSARWEVNMLLDRHVAFYARVSSESQARDNTIASQVAALRERIAADGGQLEPDHAYADEGFSGSTLVRPSLERLRDVVASGAVERLYVHAPDRLARR